jgi:hypothetical protein
MLFKFAREYIAESGTDSSPSRNVRYNAISRADGLAVKSAQNKIVNTLAIVPLFSAPGLRRFWPGRETL